MDWPNVIEEVQDVGLSELRACRSLVRQALVHLLKLHASPGSQAAAHWREEVIGSLDDAGAARALPGACPSTLDDLLAKPRNVPALAAKLDRSGGAGAA